MSAKHERTDERTAGHADAPALHEASDVSARELLWFAGGLALFLGVVALAVLWLFDLLAARENRLKASVYPLAEEERRAGQVLPPPPRLEGIKLNPERVPPIDLDAYGWTDEAAGIARVPLDQAEKRARQAGLLRSRPGGERSTGAFPADYSSGRQPRGGRP